MKELLTQNSKRPYQTPELKVHGTIKEITKDKTPLGTDLQGGAGPSVVNH